jgi:hypothetical protein
LDKWLVAIWLIASAKNGISSYEIHRPLGIAKKRAWFLGHCIRLALQFGSIEKLSGEADEASIGGMARNMHGDRNKKRGAGLVESTQTGWKISGLLKRCIKGTHVSIEPFHLFRYLDEESFRYNNREDDDGTRFQKAVSGVSGKRLTYQQLIGSGRK